MKTEVSSKPVPAARANKSTPFPWPRRQTLALGQVPFNFDFAEKEGDTPCE